MVAMGLRGRVPDSRDRHQNRQEHWARRSFRGGDTSGFQKGPPGTWGEGKEGYMAGARPSSQRDPGSGGRSRV
jgi:hypothetical protein